MIPGQLITLLTFPGVIVHEAAHLLVCRLFGLAVLEVCYFQVGKPPGYVVHETAPRPWQQVLIGVGPFLLNSVLGAVIAAPAAIPVYLFQAGDFLDYILIWLGVSIAMHAFPSTGDAASIRQALASPQTSWLTRIIAYPLVGLIYLGALGSFIWLDLLYGVAIAAVVPFLVVRGLGR